MWCEYSTCPSEVVAQARREQTSRSIPLRSPVTVLAASLLLLAALPSRAVDLSALNGVLAATSEGGWARVNLNSFLDAVPAPGDRNIFNENPQSVLGAWSSFSWDSQRGQLMLFGGGHGNYSGNEVYLWQGTSQTWTRGTMPSKVAPVVLQNGQSVYMPIDFAAPPSMHTYDNTVYLAASDRFLVLGGPAYNASSGPVKADGTPTGPFLWNPALADPNKSGGTDGSAVNPALQGSQSWSNRDTVGQFVVNGWFGTRGLNIVDGTTATAVEGGRDVVYFTATGGPTNYLAKYVFGATAAQDVITIVGAAELTPGAYGAGALDAGHGRYVSLTGSADQPFIVWDTTSGAEQANQALAITLAGGLQGFAGAGISGIDYDPIRDQFLVWTGEGDVWQLRAPASGALDDDWTFLLVTEGAWFPDGMIPDDLNLNGGGVRGKWKYIPDLDAFMALEGSVDGDVWLYRPQALVNLVPEPATLACLLLACWALTRFGARRARLALRASPVH